MSQGSHRRVVRVSVAAFQQIAAQLGEERGPDGEPSRHDFHANDLLEIVEQFATHWDELAPLIPERPDYRLLIATGRMVANYAVIGQFLSDGTIELLEIEIALLWLPDPEEDQG